MSSDIASALKARVRSVLAAQTPQVTLALRSQLAQPIHLEEGRFLQFEVDPWSWSLHLCATEEELLAEDCLTRALPEDWLEQVEQAGLDADEWLAQELASWFSACWQTVGGPRQFSPAYLFLHGYHQRQYDLEQQSWLSAAEVFGE